MAAISVAGTSSPNFAATAMHVARAAARISADLAEGRGTQGF